MCHEFCCSTFFPLAGWEHTHSHIHTHSHCGHDLILSVCLWMFLTGGSTLHTVHTTLPGLFKNEPLTQDAQIFIFHRGNKWCKKFDKVASGKLKVLPVDVTSTKLLWNGCCREKPARVLLRLQFSSEADIIALKREEEEKNRQFWCKSCENVFSTKEIIDLERTGSRLSEHKSFGSRWYIEVKVALGGWEKCFLTWNRRRQQIRFCWKPHFLLVRFKVTHSARPFLSELTYQKNPPHPQN